MGKVGVPWLIVALFAAPVDAEDRLDLGAGTVITMAVEHGDAAGNDYEFIAAIRTLDSAGLTFDWSMGAPKNTRGARTILATDLADAGAIDGWFYDREAGVKRGVSSLFWSRKLFARVASGERVTVHSAGDGVHTYHLIGREKLQVIVNDQPRDLPVVILVDEKQQETRLLDDPAAPLGLAGKAKWNARVISIRTGVAAATERHQLEAGRLVAYGIHFNTDSSELQPESSPTLAAVTAFLRDQPRVRLRIEGHTDANGSSQHNLELSRARAEAVRHQLVENGVNTSRLETKWFGSSKPLGDNTTLVGRGKNRRVVFEVLR